ncbi:MAG TPA: DUF4190 domain-containing protein [Tepidisphaeraceae bacterium]|nr:DUF4190 domain-containing protein [Tepidisphaeraceae bacterium]
MALFGRPTERDEAKAAAYRDWLLRRNPYAVASTVLGVFSLTHLGALWIDGIAAIVLGVIALRQLSRPGNAGATEGRGLAWLGIGSAAVSIIIAIFLYGSA